MISQIKLTENSTILEEINVLSERFYFIVIYSFIFVLSLWGNSFILMIPYKSKQIRVTNHYFLANISVSNLIYTSFALFPFLDELQGAEDNSWMFYDFMCAVIPLLNTLTINLNTFTMIAYSIDCLIAILRPFKPKLTKLTNFIKPFFRI